MRAVQQTQLGSLVRGDVVRDCHSRGRPVRTVFAKAVLHHPLHETFALHGPAIGNPGGRRHSLAQFIRSRGRNAVDHGTWEERVVLDPPRESRVSLAGELHYGTGESQAVVHQVVAADDRGGRRLCAPASIQRLHEISDETRGRVRLTQVVDDVRMRQVQISVGREAVALLSDGHRDGASRRGR